MKRCGIRQLREAGRKGHKQEHRRQREAEPGRDRISNAATQTPDCDADLAAARSREELAQRHHVAERMFVEPAAARDEFVAKVGKMGRRAAERSQAEPQKNTEDGCGELMCRYGE